MRGLRGFLFSAVENVTGVAFTESIVVQNARTLHLRGIVGGLRLLIRRIEPLARWKARDAGVLLVRDGRSIPDTVGPDEAEASIAEKAAIAREDRHSGEIDRDLHGLVIDFARHRSAAECPSRFEETRHALPRRMGEIAGRRERDLN